MKKMTFTPQDICDKDFNLNVKGFDIDEVNKFLDLVIEDYQKMEDNIQDLLNQLDSKDRQIQELRSILAQLQLKQKSIDLTNTTTYSSVDLLKRVSRLEETVYRK